VKLTMHLVDPCIFTRTSRPAFHLMLDSQRPSVATRHSTRPAMIFSSHDLLEPIRQAILVTRTSYSAVPLARTAHPCSAGRCGAAWRCEAAAAVAVAAQQRGGSHRTAQAHHPRVSGGFLAVPCSSPTCDCAACATPSPRHRLVAAAKIASNRKSFFALCVRLCVCHACF